MEEGGLNTVLFTFELTMGGGIFSPLGPHSHCSNGTPGRLHSPGVHT